ncbi:MAG: hypothetical protein QXM52_06410 [Candidatus Bathyarchaeia archaeon]
MGITPEKGNFLRILSDTAIMMINRLRKQNEKIIFPSSNIAQTVFYRQGKQLASELNNPRL